MLGRVCVRFGFFQPSCVGWLRWHAAAALGARLHTCGGECLPSAPMPAGTANSSRIEVVARPSALLPVVLTACLGSPGPRVHAGERRQRVGKPAYGQTHWPHGAAGGRSLLIVLPPLCRVLDATPTLRLMCLAFPLPLCRPQAQADEGYGPGRLVCSGQPTDAGGHWGRRGRRRPILQHFPTREFRGPGGFHSPT